MARELQGADVEFLLREKGVGDFKQLVCENTVFLDVTNDVTTEKTKCGTFKGVATADFKLNGEAVCNIEPTSGEVSYDQMLAWQLSITKIEWILRNKSVSGYGPGEAQRMSGDGYIVGTNYDGSNGQATKFSWNIEGVGVLNDVESP